MSRIWRHLLLENQPSDQDWPSIYLNVLSLSFYSLQFSNLFEAPVVVLYPLVPELYKLDRTYPSCSALHDKKRNFSITKIGSEFYKCRRFMVPVECQIPAVL